MDFTVIIRLTAATQNRAEVEAAIIEALGLSETITRMLEVTALPGDPDVLAWPFGGAKL